MAKSKQAISDLVYHAEKLSDTAGRMTAAFDQMHMLEIKKIQKEILNSSNTDGFMVALRKLVSHSNRHVRERAVILLGELMRSHPESKEIDKNLKELISCTRKKDDYFQPDKIANTVGKEIVIAMGKSGSSKVEGPVLQLLSNTSTVSVRQSAIVTLGKVGSSHSVKTLTNLMRNRKLTVGDQIYIAWALGRLGSVQNNTRSEFPLSRSLFNEPLIHLFKIINSGVHHPDVHYCAIYAVGEICDQRDTTSLLDSVNPSVLKQAETNIASIGKERYTVIQSLERNKKFKGNSTYHADRLIDLAEKAALKMILGQQLDSEGERILLDARILLDVIALEE